MSGMTVQCAHDEVVDIDLLVPNPKNPNKHPKNQIELLAKIMKHQGWRSPIVVSNRSGFIIKGHGRLEAAKLNGWTEAPIDRQDYASEADEYADMVADNKIAELSDTDLNMVIDDVKLLGDDFDFDLLGIPDFQLPEEFEPQADEDDVPGVPIEPITKRGDIWQLGRHRLMCGDSTSFEDADKLLSGEKAEMLFTDPPYGVDYSGGIQFVNGEAQKNNRRKLANDDSPQIYKDIAPVIAATVDGPCYTWFASTKARCVIEAIEAIEAIGELHALIIWHKINAKYGALNAQYKQRHEPCFYWKPNGSTLRWDGPTNECTVWDLKRDSKNEFHPTQKPVELAERAISNHKANTVLDLFGGSGSTLIACEKTGRNCFMMELDPHYCDVIISRWEKYTGKKAERITEGESA